MRAVCIFFSLILFAPVNVFAELGMAKEIKKVEPEIKTYLKQRARDEDAQSSPYITALIRGDIDGDGKQDAFISYSIEGIGGGNLAILYQALFLNNGKKLVFKAERENGNFGAAQGTSFIPKKIEKGKVVCDTETYGPDDDACCPSIKGNGEILFVNGKLAESYNQQK